MAEPIQHRTQATRTTPDGHQELERLLETLHRSGVLRLLNDWIASAPQVSSLVVQGLKTDGANNAVQNLALVMQTLGRIPPGQLYQVLSAAEDGLKRTTEFAPRTEVEPPGVTGAYKLLKDEALWEALIPMLEGLKAFSHELNRRVDKPSAELDTQQAHIRRNMSTPDERAD